MIGQNSYKQFRFATKKIGWILAARTARKNRNIGLAYLLTEEGEQELLDCYHADPDQIEGEIERNLVKRNMAYTHGNAYTEQPRLFHMEIFEVYRKTIVELRTIYRCNRYGITAEDVGIEARNWNEWKEGRRPLAEEPLECLCIANDFHGREMFLNAYRRAMKLVGSWEWYRNLPTKDGCEVRLQLLHEENLSPR